MQIVKSITGKQLTVTLVGSLNSITAPELDKELAGDITKVQKLILDLAQLEYMSSSGLRILLSAQNSLDAQDGQMIIRNVNETVTEIFEITGFVDVLTIE